MKKIISFLIVITLLTSCGSEKIEVSPKKVNTINIESTEVENYAQYSGYLLANEVKKYSFTQGGLIESVNVKKGDEIKAGAILATLDSQQINLAKTNAVASKGLAENQSAQANINISSLQKNIAAEEIVLKQLNDAYDAEKLKLNTVINTYEKNISQLEDKFNLIKDTYEKNKTLLDSGVISKSEFDNVEIQYNNANDELNALYKEYDTNVNLQNISVNNAKNNIEAQKIKIQTIENQINSANVSKNSALLQVEQSEIGVEQYENQLDDMTLKATMDGAVVEVIVKEGEVTGAGTPVIVVKSNTKIVNVGVSISDYEKIKLGQNIIATFDGYDYAGVVTNIASYPDEITKIYEVEVELSENSIPLGSLVNIKFPISDETGVLIPISSIVNKSGVNYVYIVTEDNLVNKKEVILGEVSTDKVSVKGLEVGMKLIVDNFSQLQENDIVIVD